MSLHDIDHLSSDARTVLRVMHKLSCSYRQGAEGSLVTNWPRTYDPNAAYPPTGEDRFRWSKALNEVREHGYAESFWHRKREGGSVVYHLTDLGCSVGNKAFPDHGKSLGGAA